MARLRRGLGWPIAALLLAGFAPPPEERDFDISRTRGPGPTIVFENGLTARKEAWTKVIAGLGPGVATFTYDRAGVGESADARTPRDGEHVVEDLRTLLQANSVTPPYILVGHSVGGLYVQLFARRHPEEVAGLVLVDSTHPTQFEGEGAMRKRGPLSQLAATFGFRGSARAEFMALGETGQQVLASPALKPGLPTIILIAPDTSGSAMAAVDNAKRADFARLYPSGAMRTVDGGHNVPITRPDMVVAAIRDVTAAVTASRP